MALDKSATEAADKEFFAKHPERNGKPLQKGEPGYDALAKEWRELYNKNKSAKPKPSPTAKPSEEPKYNAGIEKPKVAQACPKPDKGKVKVRVTMFFDGTNNNKYNVKKGPQTGWLDYFKGADSSYGNGLTNIARLSDAWQGYQECYDIADSIYIEGIGTHTDGGDSQKGSMFGTGSAGIDRKVENGLTELVFKIGAHSKTLFDEVQIEFVKLDVFGFSRGAAAARNFIWAALEHEKPSRKLVSRLKAENRFKSVGEIKFMFVGLYDTVSSYGVTSFKDDVQELHLDAVTKAERVVHLCGADEHRKNFALTNIKSVGAGKGVELFFPGVHSDVGGSYISGVGDDLVLMNIQPIYVAPNDYQMYAMPGQSVGTYYWPNNATDEEVYQKFQRESDWLVKCGWYLEDEITCPKSLGDGTGNKLTGKRISIGEEYSYIHLMLMERFAADPRYGIVFQDIPQNYSIDGDKTLETAKREIETYIVEKASSPPPNSSGFNSKPGDWFKHPDPPPNAKAFLKDLRHEHLHCSSRYETAESFGITAMGPNFCEGDPKDGGASDRLQLTGHRERAIYDG